MIALVPDDRNTYVADFPVSDLNPRKEKTRYYSQEATEVLTSLINKFGIMDPLVIDEENNIVHGQLRYTIAKELGLTTVPVIITRTVSKKMETPSAYHMIVDRLIEWDKWNYSSTNDLLLAVAEKELSKDGETWRDAYRKIGWFDQDKKKKPTATKETLEKISKTHTRWLPSRFNFNNAQVLYIEAIRKEIQDFREGLIERGEIDGGVPEKYKRHMEEEANAAAAGEAITPAAETLKKLEKEYRITSKPTLGDRAKKQGLKTANKVNKNKAKKFMTEYQFLFFAKTYTELSEEEAKAYYASSTPKAFKKFCDEFIEADPTIPANQSKKVGQNG